LVGPAIFHEGIFPALRTVVVTFSLYTQRARAEGQRGGRLPATAIRVPRCPARAASPTNGAVAVIIIVAHWPSMTNPTWVDERYVLVGRFCHQAGVFR